MITTLGRNRFVHAVANGAPRDIKLIEIVPMRSMTADDAPVKGVFGCFAIVSYRSWYTPKTNVIPQAVNMMVKEARTTMMGRLYVVV